MDEIGEMPLDLQVGLLRVIQEQSVTRLGSTESRQLDVRFLAATNQNVRSLINERRFRADLYYRLSMVEISLPPLREREGDVALLVDHFNRDLSDSLRLPCTPLPEDVMKALANYTWPGNVRELRNVVERSLIMAGEGAKVTLEDLPVHVANAVSVGMSFEGPALSMAAVAGQSGRMAPVGGGLSTGMYSPSTAFDRAGAGAYDGPSAVGYGYQASMPFGEAAPGVSPCGGAVPYGGGFDAMAGFGLRAADGSSEPPSGWQSGESYSRQEQDVVFSAASSAGFPAGTTGAALQEEDPAEADRTRIVKAIRGSDGDLLLAAELLGVTYAALRKRMAEIGIRVKTSIEIE